MATNGLGPRLSTRTATSFTGGEATWYERGMMIAPADGENIEIAFHFPMIGRPHIATGDPATAFALDASTVTFSIGSTPLDVVERLVHDAFTEQFWLKSPGQDAAVPLTLGAAELLSDGPTVYGMSATAPMQERVLYDVVTPTSGQALHVLAPHAVYHRPNWHDFGIAHITDMHVARRIDGFRGILRELGRNEAADKMYNWNDRFRGFIRYANYLHGIGVLDVIVATGDLFDYIFEADDDQNGGGNAQFLRDLLLGQAPGPDFPDIEELRVPIFMVPGNHDYRKNPYTLLFNLDFGVKEVQVKNYYGYHMLWDDALALTRRKNGMGSDDVPDLGTGTAADAVEIDAENRPYKTLIADRGSYIVQLGDHRIAMLDSSWDVGVLTDRIDALRTIIGNVSEDEATFVGGSPNCEGISDEELAMTAAALAETPADALFMVGIHAPLFNMWSGEYPYYLRETQRAVHDDQVIGFLSRHDVRYPGQDTVEGETQQMRARHGTWFPSDRDHREPTFVKRTNTDDLLDYGVSRGHADGLVELLAGVGSARRADVVLAGHTHRRNEFTVLQNALGELVFSMDFYTDNPSTTYPTRFLTGWQGGSNGVRPTTDITYVDVVPGAPPNLSPSEMPWDAMHDWHVEVPPYPTPLSEATDTRAWWDAHRPLVLQTGALGPLDNSQVSFTGFRVLTVKGDVIDRIHYLYTERLEASGYRMSWDDAIRPDPPRRYLHLARSQEYGTPTGAGSPTSLVIPASSGQSGVENIVYRDGDDRLHELWRDANGVTGTTNLTANANAPAATGNPSAYLDTTNVTQIVPYRGTDGHVHTLYWSTGAVGHDNLTAAAGAPGASGDPVGWFVASTNEHHVVYRDGDDHLIELWWAGTGDVGHGSLSALVDAPKATGAPSAYHDASSGTNIVAYRGDDGGVHTLYWSTGDVGHDNLSGYCGAPPSAGDPAAYYMAHVNVHQVTYRSVDGHLIELYWAGADPVTFWDLSAIAGGPPAVGDPAVYFSAGTNTKHVIYRSGNDHLNEIWWVPGGGTPSWVDLTLAALAPPSADDPTAFTVDGPNSQHVVYRGTDNQIHEIRWT
jgi:Calcineurin-like phosphoesterase